VGHYWALVTTNDRHMRIHYSRSAMLPLLLTYRTICVWLVWFLYHNTGCSTHTRTHTHTHNCFTSLWILSGTTRVSQYQKKHSPTHTHRGHQISLSASSIYYDPSHPPYAAIKSNLLFLLIFKLSLINLKWNFTHIFGNYEHLMLKFNKFVAF